ncbi:PaaI family thioesterase [Halostella pelagica]|uniref:PaaI family thioesterase n=1 Tax=Halostella pelagica TaxID=2583824 RepID=UPI001F3FDEB3|nr:PaaI family thioesterase [Halostella pelagica]
MDDLNAQSLFERLPFVEHLGIELESVEDGRAVATLDLAEHHSSVPWSTVAHGGVTYSLADTVGGAAVFSLHQQPNPTIDMRIDYLSPATESLRAEAEVDRDGDTTTVVSVDITNGAGDAVADARGVYKTAGGEGQSTWTTRDGDAEDPT